MRAEMLLAIPFPPISSEIVGLDIGSFRLALRWYSLAYLLGLGLGWWIIWKAMARPTLWPADRAPMQPAQVEGLLTAVVLGVILGGRLGYVIFYEPATYLAEPWRIPRIDQGGMAFHGGLAGVIVAAWIYCRRVGAPPLQIADAMAMVIGIGLFLGRIANFINAELWGRASDVPWAVIFPGTAAQNCPGPEGLVEHLGVTLCARHPSQLYEAVSEGLVLGGLALYLAWRRGWLKRPGALTGLFLLIYGLARFAVEFVRQPDQQFQSPDNPIGFALALSPSVGLTMGQILTLPMIAAGLWLLVRARSRARTGDGAQA